MRSLLIAFLICGFAAAGFLGWQYYQSEQSREHLLSVNTAVSDFLATLETRDPSQLGAAAADLARKFTGDDSARFRDVLENAFVSRIRKNPESRAECIAVLQTLYPHSALVSYIGAEEDRSVMAAYSQAALPRNDISAPAVRVAPVRQAAVKVQPAAVPAPAVKPAAALPAAPKTPVVPKPSPAPEKKAAAAVRKTVQPAEKKAVATAPKKVSLPAKKAVATTPKKVPDPEKKATAEKTANVNPAHQLVQSAWKGDVRSLRAALAAGADPQMRVRGQNGKVTSLLSALLLRTKQMPVPGKMIPVIIELMKAGAEPTQRDRDLIASIPELAGALE